MGLVYRKDKAMRFPSTKKCERSVDAVLNVKWFFGFVGAVDACHITIERPREEKYAYVNRKVFHSFALVGVCDENIILTGMSVGWPGSVHDSDIRKLKPKERSA